jgi:F0F1-type ATP synthase assembly protein I
MADDKKKNLMYTGMKYAHVGLIIPTAVVGGWFLGSLLDRYFGTKWIQLAGMGLGVVAGFTDLIRTAMQMNKETPDPHQPPEG